MKNRKCFKCGKKLEECMGFVLARDVLRKREHPRELCGKCALVYDVVIDDINPYVYSGPEKV
jgi:hypothetical protein